MGDVLDDDARRILRRMSESSARLAASPSMELAVVVRETLDGRTIRTAVAPNELVNRLERDDLIHAVRMTSSISHFVITTKGRRALSGAGK